MTDVLIRDVPEDDLAKIDKLAARLGLSRGEYLRRRIHEEGVRLDVSFTPADFDRVAEVNRDLLDEDVMRDAWS